MSFQAARREPLELPERFAGVRKRLRLPDPRACRQGARRVFAEGECPDALRESQAYANGFYAPTAPRRSQAYANGFDAPTAPRKSQACANGFYAPTAPVAVALLSAAA